MGTALLPFAALIAGVLSFSSPCCLPLVPGYLSYVSALPVADLGTAEARRVTIRASVLFVAGFTAVFTVLGIGAGAMGAALLANQDTIVRWSGLLIVVLGLSTAGLVRLPLLGRERRLDLARLPKGPGWAFPLGMAFAAGWVPCVGPILATILATAAAGGSIAWGALLLALYSVGLGVPFILLALGYHRANRTFGWLRRHGLLIERSGGVLLVGVGLLFLTGRWDPLFRPLQRWFAEFGWPPI